MGSEVMEIEGWSAVEGMGNDGDYSNAAESHLFSDCSIANPMRISVSPDIRHFTSYNLGLASISPPGQTENNIGLLH